jgi:hypothetical protein
MDAFLNKIFKIAKTSNFKMKPTKIALGYLFELLPLMKHCNPNMQIYFSLIICWGD